MSENETKPTNPKDSIGSDKMPVHLWPETATIMGSLGLLDGALKYGRSNYRAIGVRATIYVDAAKRHLNAWFEGENNDPDSGLPHFAHALACLAILVDAQAADMLNDDRQYPGGYRKLLNEMTPHVARLKALHASKSPKQYSIKDKVVRQFDGIKAWIATGVPLFTEDKPKGSPLEAHSTEYCPCPDCVESRRESRSNCIQ